MHLKVNGRDHVLDVEPWWTLLDVIRDRMGLTGCKKGCDEGVCGACTVIMNGRAIVSCLAFAVEFDGMEVTTIEELCAGDKLDPLQEAFIAKDGMQCGFCTPGQIMAARGLLNSNPEPSEEEIREALSGNICRCGCYNKIVEAVLASVGVKKSHD